MPAAAGPGNGDPATNDGKANGGKGLDALLSGSAVFGSHGKVELWFEFFEGLRSTATTAKKE